MRAGDAASDRRSAAPNVLIAAGLGSPGWVLAGGVLTLLIGLYLVLRVGLPRPLAVLPWWQRTTLALAAFVGGALGAKLPFALAVGCTVVSRPADQTTTAKIEAKTGQAADKIAMATDDTAITAKVKAAILAEPGLKSLQINVDTKDATVTLSGNVDSDMLRDRAKQIATSTEGVRNVVDNLTVKTG